MTAGVDPNNILMNPGAVIHEEEEVRRPLSVIWGIRRTLSVLPSVNPFSLGIEE